MQVVVNPTPTRGFGISLKLQLIQPFVSGSLFHSPRILRRRNASKSLAKKTLIGYSLLDIFISIHLFNFQEFIHEFI